MKNSILHFGLTVFATLSLTVVLNAEIAVIGHAYLNNQTNHSGIKVNFQKISPSAISDSTYTAADGSYAIALAIGIYNIYFTKDGYQPGEQLNKYLSKDSVLQDVTLIVGSTQEVSGNVRGRFTKNVIYFVVGDLTVSINDTLIIDPGTKVKFRGLYNMTVSGLLKAVGQDGDTILFTSSNSMPLPGDWGKISFNNADTNCEISYAKILNATDGINATNTNVMKITHCIIDRIQTGGNGIHADNSSNSIFSYNTISNVYNGIQDLNGGKLTAMYNKITGFAYGGLYFQGSPNSVIKYNYLDRQNGWVNSGNGYGIWATTSIVDSNNIFMVDDNCYNNDKFGIYAQGKSIIRTNNIKLSASSCWGNGGRGICAQNNGSLISGNTIEISSQSCCGSGPIAILTTDQTSIEKNTILFKNGNPSGINTGLNSIVNDNLIKNVSGNGGSWAITIGSGTQVISNQIINNNYGISIYAANKQTLIQGNLLKLNGGTGIDINGSSLVRVFNNTCTGNGCCTGLNVAGDSHPQVRGNIFGHFDTGINAQSEIYDMMYNDVYGNSTNFTGSLPQQAGQMVTTNARGTQSDIYYNISQYPNYRDTSKIDFSPKVPSPCIDAGDPNLTDPDGTTADIGAYFCDFGRTPYSVKIDTAYDATVKVSWQAVKSDSLQGYNMYRKLTSVNTYTYVASVPVGTNTYTITNLTNNVSYDFAVTSVYQTRESIKSTIATAVPGIAKISLSPRTVEAVLPANDSVNIGVTIQNLGTKDLKYRFIYSDYSYYKNNFDSVSLPSDWTVYGSGWYCNGSYLGNSCCCGGTIIGGNSAWTDIVLEADVYLGQNQSGIVVRAQDQSNYTLLQFNPSDNQRMYWIVNKNGNWYQLASGYMGKGFGEWLHIKIIATGSKYEAYADGILSLSMDDATYMAGKIGFYTNCSNNTQWYDNLIVRYGAFQTSNELTVQPAQQGATTINVSSRGYTSGNYLIPPLTIGSNDVAKPIVTLPVLLSVTGGAAPPAPTYFHPVSSTGQPYTFVISSGKIDTSDLQAGDEIGIYDDTICVGAGVFDGKYLYKLTAWQTSGGQSGFTAGHTIKVRLYQNATRRLARGTLSFSIGDGTFVPGEFSVASVNGTVYTEQDIVLTGNQFNLISFNHQPRTPAITNILLGLDSVKITYDDRGGVYIPKYSINTIGDIDFREGYQVYITGPDDTLSVTGLTVIPSSWALTLEAKKFNSIPFFGTMPYLVTQAFSSISSSIKIIQSSDGTAWIPGESINTLGNLQPGKGYQAFINGTSNISFTYPDAISPPMFKVSVPTQVFLAKSAEAAHFKYVKTGLPYIVVLKVPTGIGLETGDEVGVFDSTVCVGSVLYDGTEHVSVCAWQASSEAQLPGFKMGHTIAFRLFKQTTGHENIIHVSASKPEEALFGGAAFSRFSITGLTSVSAQNELPTQFALQQNYPNPFNPVTVINYQLPAASHVIMKVYDILGREVIELVNEVKEAGYYTACFDASKLSSGVFFYSMQAGDFRSVKKMLLVK